MMDIISHIKAFLFSIIPLILHFSSNANQRQPPPEGITTRRPNPPPPPADHDIETGPAEHNPQPASPVVVAGHQNLDYWTKVILAFCFASAIDIAILSVQIHLKVPPTFHLLSLVISFAFASLFVSLSLIYLVYLFIECHENPTTCPLISGINVNYQYQFLPIIGRTLILLPLYLWVLFT